MVDVNALKAEWVRNGLTQYQVAENILGISSRGFHEKLKKGILGSDEIENLIIKVKSSYKGFNIYVFFFQSYDKGLNI